MKLGELITTLQDYRDSTVGVDDDTEVVVTVPEVEVRAEVNEIKAEITVKRDWNEVRRSQATLILECGEV